MTCSAEYSSTQRGMDAKNVGRVCLVEQSKRINYTEQASLSLVY